MFFWLYLNFLFSMFLIYFSVWPIEDDHPALAKFTRRVEHLTNLFASSKLGQSDNFMVLHIVDFLLFILESVC